MTGIGAFIALSLIVYAADPHAAGNSTRSAPTAAATDTVPAVSRPVPTATAKAAAPPSTTVHKPSFPPTKLAAFRTFASAGDASQVHQVGASSEGLPSCPVPNIYVTVDRGLSVRALEANLAAFFVQSGLINNPCQAFLFAYHSRSDYKAHLGDGYTVGRVALTNMGSGSQHNLEVDAGEVTSETYNVRTQFNFNF